MKYIVAIISFLFSFLGVWVLVTFPLGVFFPREDAMVIVGSGAGWRNLPGIGLGVVAGVVAWKVALRKEREKEAKKRACSRGGDSGAAMVA